MNPLYEFALRTLEGESQTLQSHRGRVLLIVNVASQCGFTPQYEGLEKLHRELGPRGLSVLAFPCDQFGHQEPGDSATIRDFCSTRFAVSFPVFEKIEVNGAEAAPLYRHLKQQKPGWMGSSAVKWNFTKFLVNRAGEVVGRYAPWSRPEALRADIERLLGPESAAGQPAS